MFIDRILSEEDGIKFADVWPIEKVRGEQFSNSEQLKSRVNKDLNKKTCNDCKKMIDDILKKLGDVIKSGGLVRHCPRCAEIVILSCLKTYETPCIYSTSYSLRFEQWSGSNDTFSFSITFINSRL